MDCLTLLHDARAAGLQVIARDDQIVVRGPRRLASVARRLLDAKSDVMPILEREQDQADPQPAASTSRWKVNPGWSPASWIHYLRQRADGCQDFVPARAAELREWADGLETEGVNP